MYDIIDNSLKYGWTVHIVMLWSYVELVPLGIITVTNEYQWNILTIVFNQYTLNDTRQTDQLHRTDITVTTSTIIVTNIDQIIYPHNCDSKTLLCDSSVIIPTAKISKRKYIMGSRLTEQHVYVINVGFILNAMM